MLFALTQVAVVGVEAFGVRAAVVEVRVAAFVVATDSSGQFRILRLVFVGRLALAFVSAESVATFGVFIAIV